MCLSTTVGDERRGAVARAGAFDEAARGAGVRTSEEGRVCATNGKWASVSIGTGAKDVVANVGNRLIVFKSDPIASHL